MVRTIARPFLAVFVVALLAGGVFWFSKHVEQQEVVTESASIGDSTVPRYTIGLLSSSNTLDTVLESFESEMNSIAKKQQVKIAYVKLSVPFTETNIRRAIDTLVDGHKVDVIVTGQSQFRLVQEKDPTIPVIVTLSAAPVAGGLAKSESGSGSSAVFVDTGNNDTAGRRLEEFLKILPSIKRVLVLRGADSVPGVNLRAMPSLIAVAQEKNITLIDKQFSTRQELNDYLLSVDPNSFDAIYRYPDTFVASNVDLILGLANQSRLNKPVVVINREELSKGGLLAYGASLDLMGRQSANLAKQILLEKVDPATIPVVHQKSFSLGLNVAKARVYGLDVTPTLRAHFDYLIGED